MAVALMSRLTKKKCFIKSLGGFIGWERVWGENKGWRKQKLKGKKRLEKVVAFWIKIQKRKKKKRVGNNGRSVSQAN